MLVLVQSKYLALEAQIMGLKTIQAIVGASF